MTHGKRVGQPSDGLDGDDDEVEVAVDESSGRWRAQLHAWCRPG